MEDIIRERLEWFRDLKFGFMVHWGPYAQKGCIESWPLSEEDTWARPGWEGDMEEFKEEYWSLNRTFNPENFDPEVWADAASGAGMRYFVFTTKHHDGFNMYDTRLSEYRITAPTCPFHRHPHADVTRALFEAFRGRDLGIGAYYSKADWHSPHYWRPGRAATNRYPNYDPGGEPEVWARFVDFVHGQIRELVTRYGRIDILWLDAGQVRPPGLDLDMDRLVAMARRRQPGLLVVDRTVGGPHENYLTPEQEVPDEPLDEPWESCITMGTQWSYRPRDAYKSTRELIHLLVDIVVKGGNLLLNVGPRPDGRLPGEALERMEEIGAWLEVNGEAVYGTRVQAPHRRGPLGYTHAGDTVYAIHMLGEGETLPGTLHLELERGPKSGIELLGTGRSIPFQRSGEGLVLDLPPEVRDDPPSRYACVFKVH